MGETCEQLTQIGLGGEDLQPFHSVLVRSPFAWHVILIDLPAYSCPAVGERHPVGMKTLDGRVLAGSVTTEVVTSTMNGSYVLLTGIGQLTNGDGRRAAA